MSAPTSARVAVLIPCYNEAAAITAVVRDFRAALPDATIYVYDNNSRDGTAAAAQQAGAVVRTERLQGKGHVIRRMFADIEADAYILVDGDDTYCAASSPAMVRLLLDDGLDMVNGTRISEIRAAYRRGHRFGNAALSGLVAWVFGGGVSDMLSGYRVFSRRFVKSFPALSGGFETEAEFTVHALELRMPIGEVPTPYKERPAGSASKLRTYRDGLRILRTIIRLVKEERPLQFFTSAAVLQLALALRPRRAGFYRLHPHRPGAAPANGGAVDWDRAAGLSLIDLRPDPRLGDPWPQGVQAAVLSFDSGLPTASPASHPVEARENRPLPPPKQRGADGQLG